MGAIMTEQDKIAIFTNPVYGIAAIVTSIKKGYAVTFLDTDADAIITTRIYPHDMKPQAIAYAQNLTQ
jgi:hypothetical protein